MKLGELNVTLSVTAHHEWVGRDGRLNAFAVVGIRMAGAPRGSVSVFLFDEDDLKSPEES